MVHSGPVVAQAKSKRRSAEARQVAQARFDALTPRQQAVFHELLTGAPNKVIAHRLKIRERTVKAHRQALLQKLQVQNLVDLLQFSAALGLDTRPPEDDMP